MACFLFWAPSCSTNIHMLRLRCTLNPQILTSCYTTSAIDRYKRGLLKTMLDRAFRLSSNWHYFSEECDRLKLLFSRLKYPDKVANSTISRFVAAKASDQPVSSPTVSDRSEPIRVVLPFKDQASADIVHAQLKNLSPKIHTTVQPVFVSQKIEQDLKLQEAKPPIVKHSALFTSLNVTCAMQVMLVSHAAICTNALKNTKTLLHQ